MDLQLSKQRLKVMHGLPKTIQLMRDVGIQPKYIFNDHIIF